MPAIVYLLSLILAREVAWADDTPVAVAAVGQAPEKSTDSSEDPKFQEKLGTMLTRTETSIKLLREQITQNQSAPFLADLYLQLGDFLAQKSTVLYYIQMERDKNTDLKVQASKKFSPVVVAQQEAIGIYQLLLKEFPKFDKRDKVLYRLAVGQKSIDEGAAFVQTSEQLIKEYPLTKESMQARLLCGQYFYDQQDYDKALGFLTPIVSTSFAFERNAARYRIGLIRLFQEKHTEALKLFEQVAVDAELKEEDNPNEISLKNKAVKSNVKREALIDSVRAYTEVYKTNADPVGYYSRVAPTEVLFQETIEKLAFRYIFLKKYEEAIKLLRTLSERTADPQKIVNIYHEVLLMIPFNGRLELPVQEMQFVLTKYDYWSTHFNLSPKLRAQALEFFETQIRELGTRSHDLAKKETDKARKDRLLERARQYYTLYIGFFDKGPRTVKIAINLADVYFNQGNFLNSGSLYLRIFDGEFGKPTARVTLIQNAILSLQKPTDYAFYEQLRVKGLLVKAITSYQAMDKSQRNDPSLNFTLAKTYYEQGYYERAIRDLFGFMKSFPKAKEVEAASDLILHYFNTRSDVAGLVEWSQRMLGLNLVSRDLRARLESVRSKALLKKLDEQVKSQSGYDVFSQGKSYLQSALSSSDSSLRSAAFEQALGRSRAEKDIETFVRAASAMAKSEKNGQKRSELESSLAEELLALTRFNQTWDLWRKSVSDQSLPRAPREKVFEKMVRLALLLRDLPRLSVLMDNSMIQGVPPETKTHLQQALSAMMESPVEIPEGIYRHALTWAKNDEDLLPLFKSQFRLSAGLRQVLLQKIANRCRGSMGSNLCKWSAWSQGANELQLFAGKAAKTAPALTNIEPTAKFLSMLLDKLKSFEGTGDPQLDILVTLAQGAAYNEFAKFLRRAAEANAEVAQVLAAKADESVQSSKKARAHCDKILTASSIVTPTGRACAKGTLPSLNEALTWPRPVSLRAPHEDSRSKNIQDQQKKIFVNRKDWKLYFELAEMYLNEKQWSFAAATSVYGSSTFASNKEEFNAVLGCAVLRMGLVNEAQFHLSKASDIGGLKEGCLSAVKSEVRAR